MPDNDNDKVYSDINGEWYLRHNGGRLADIFHVSNPVPVDCIQVGAYDWQNGRLTEKITRDKLRRRLNRWVREQSETFSRELPYLP